MIRFWTLRLPWLNYSEHIIFPHYMKTNHKPLTCGSVFLCTTTWYVNVETGMFRIVELLYLDKYIINRVNLNGWEQILIRYWGNTFVCMFENVRWYVYLDFELSKKETTTLSELGRDKTAKRAKQTCENPTLTKCANLSLKVWNL